MWKSWMQYPCEWSHNKGLSCSNLLNLSSSQIHVKITGVDDLAKINFTFKVLQSCPRPKLKIEYLLENLCKAVQLFLMSVKSSGMCNRNLQHHLWVGVYACVLCTKGRVQKKNWGKVWSFAKPGGGGSARVVKKPNCFFEKSIFQRVSRIILGPPKHVLHLVWSAYFISTAVRTALKVARTPQILGERRQL